MSNPISDALIDKLNTAIQAQQAYADAHTTTDGDPTTEALYEATYELCHALTQQLTKVNHDTPLPHPSDRTH